MGGAPLLDSSWDEESFDDKVLFDQQPMKVVESFLKLRIHQCYYENESQEIVCLRYINPLIISDDLIDDIARMFKQLQIENNLTKSIGQEYQDFRQKQVR